MGISVCEKMFIQMLWRDILEKEIVEETGKRKKRMKSMGKVDVPQEAMLS